MKVCMFFWTQCYSTLHGLQYSVKVTFIGTDSKNVHVARLLQSSRTKPAVSLRGTCIVFGTIFFFFLAICMLL